MTWQALFVRPDPASRAVPLELELIGVEAAQLEAVGDGHHRR